jgi:hypothetical protein
VEQLPELDEEYEARRDDENMDRTTRMRHCERRLDLAESSAKWRVEPESACKTARRP